MDTDITKLTEALISISNVLKEIYGKDNQIKEVQAVQEPTMQAQPGIQQPINTLAPITQTMADSGSFEIAPIQTAHQIPQQVTATPVIETDKDKIKRLEAELAQMRQSNINFNFAPAMIGGQYGQGNN